MPERVLVDRELVARMAVLVAREVVARTARMAAVPGAGNCSNSAAAAAAADIAGTNTDKTSQNDKHIKYHQACICDKINRGKASVMFGLKPYLRPSWKIIALLFGRVKLAIILDCMYPPGKKSYT